MTAHSPRWSTLALGTGALLGAAAIFNQWSKGSAERAHPPLGQFVEIDGVRLHYLDRGSGSAVVLIHGSGSLMQDFVVSGLVDALAGTHRVITFDRPGYGYSARPRDRAWTPEEQAALMVAACDKLGIRSPLVVGHSWGTLPALAWALDNPDKLRGLVLMSGYYYATPRPDAVFTGVLVAPVLGDLLTHTIAPLQTRVTGPLGIKMIFSPDAAPEAFVEEMPFLLMLRPSQLHATAADSGQMPLAAARLQQRYDELKLPITIIWGEGDKLVDQQVQSGKLAKAFPLARALPIAGQGHMLHHSDRAAVEAEVLAAAA